MLVVPGVSDDPVWFLSELRQPRPAAISGTEHRCARMASRDPRTAFREIEFKVAVCLLKHYGLPVRSAIDLERLAPGLAVVRAAPHHNPLLVAPLPERVSSGGPERREHQDITIAQYLAETISEEPCGILTTRVCETVRCEQLPLADPVHQIRTGRPEDSRAVATGKIVLRRKNIRPVGELDYSGICRRLSTQHRRAVHIHNRAVVQGKHGTLPVVRMGIDSVFTGVKLAKRSEIQRLGDSLPTIAATSIIRIFRLAP